jgi:hypothetical protein
MIQTSLRAAIIDLGEADGGSNPQHRSRIPVSPKQLKSLRLHSKAENLREQLTLAMHDAFTNCRGLFETRCVWQVHLAHFGGLIWPTLSC